MTVIVSALTDGLRQQIGQFGERSHLPTRG
jgi:hypothetical protein